MKRGLAIAARVLVLAAGAAYAWHYRFFVNPDGVSYLDLGDRILRDGWFASINSHWSPLYPLLISGARQMLGASIEHDSAIAHAVTFALFCAAFASFEWLLRQLQRNAPDLVWLPLGYALFLWSCVFADQSGPALLTPDLLVATGFFLASGLLVRIANGVAGWLGYAALGITLGISYLAKAPMMPIGFCFLIAAAMVGTPRRIPHVVAAAMLFLSIGSLYYVPLSLRLGKPTFGESGTYNYIWRVAATGQPIHPKLLIEQQPRVIGYPPPLPPGTYPLHADPGYWLAGERPLIALKPQLRALQMSVYAYCDILRSPLHFTLLVLFIVLICTAPDRRPFAYWYLMLPAICTLAMFALVLVEVRYVSHAIVVLWLASFAPLPQLRQRPSTAVVLALSAAVILTTATMLEARSALQSFLEPQTDDDRRVAESLTHHGLKPGDAVMAVGDPYMCRWARLAGVHISADMADAHDFWRADDVTRRRIESSLQRFGVRAIVARDTPETLPRDWVKIDDTEFSVRMLPPSRR